MALVNIETVLQETLNAIRTCPPGTGLELLSYKRNRSIALVMLDKQTLRMIENGYVKKETRISTSQLRKRLKTAIAREFPRSRKVRLCKLLSFEDLSRPRQKI
jgi:hypothetical protein